MGCCGWLRRFPDENVKNIARTPSQAMAGLSNNITDKRGSRLKTQTKTDLLDEDEAGGRHHVHARGGRLSCLCLCV
jgi:hypothetical protein